MTIEEKLQHFYTASIDSAMQEAQQVQTQHQEALDKIFQEHKETKERQIQSHIQAETDNLKREINKTVSARQLEYRRLLSDKTEEIKQQLFHDVAERLAQFQLHTGISGISLPTDPGSLRLCRRRCPCGLS